MQFAMWTYPWDLRDEGISDAIECLEGIGIDEINLATNYHTVHTFHPHNPERRTWFSHASAFFQPGDAYGRLAPIPYEGMGHTDWFEEIASIVSSSSLALNAWTVGCHNSRLGERYPEYTITSPHGDSLVFGLCPSHPDVMAYLRGLVGDLADRDACTRIELETFDYFYGTGFGWHHRKIQTRLGNLGEFLIGLCFCSACRENAGAADIDVVRAREICRSAIDAIASGDLPPDLDASRWVNRHEPVARYVRIRAEHLTDLYRSFRELTDAELGLYIGMTAVADTWQFGIDLDAIADVVDFVVVLAYESTPQDVLDEIHTVRAFVDLPVHVGILPGHPPIHDEQTLTEIVDAVIDAGVERISFYNYGLLPRRNLDWIAKATEPYR